MQHLTCLDLLQVPVEKDLVLSSPISKNSIEGSWFLVQLLLEEQMRGRIWYIRVYRGIRVSPWLGGPTS